MPKKNLTIRLDEDMQKWLEQQAQKELRPVANLVIYILTEYMRNQNGISGREISD